MQLLAYLLILFRRKNSLIRLFYPSFLILFACIITTANAKNSTLDEHNIEFEALSELELLKKARLFSRDEQSKSFLFANEALRLSGINNNHLVSAKVHAFLGTLTYQANNVDVALNHFSQASSLYEKINDKSNQIKYSISYIDILLDIRQYKKADIMLDELLPMAIDYGKPLPIALTLIAKGDNFYHQKYFNDAIKEYIDASEYLSGDDKKAKKHLGEAYKKIAQSYKRLKNREKTVYFYKKTLTIYTTLRETRLIARTLNTLAEAERYLGNLVIALEYSIRGLEIYKQLDDPVGRTKALMGAGIIYRHIGRYEKSLEHIYEAHLYYKKINDINGLAKSANQLGYIYTRLLQFEQAKYFYQLSIDLSGNKIDQQTLASALREMAVIDLNSGEYKSAMIMAKKAYEIVKSENDKSKSSLITRVIGNIYRAQKDSFNAISYYRQSLIFAIEVKSKIYQIKAQTALGGALIGIDSKEAISLLKNSVSLSTEIDDKNQMLYAYRKLLAAEKSQGNVAESLYYAEKEIALTNVIQQENDHNQLILAKANLYSHKMEIELDSLREKSIYDQLELTKKNNEIEIAAQTRTITELQLLKNKYSSIALVLLLGVCVLLVVFIYRRFSLSKKRNKELDYLVIRDPLTNCYNRRILFEMLNRDFDNAERVDEYCLIMADIDYFKAVNDNYGHNIGDSVICGVANILQACVKQNDIVSRFGGEEFCIVLHQVSQSQAMTIAGNMREKIENTDFNDIAITCSFGITSIKFSAKSPAELIHQADMALYESKSVGRNRVTMWNDKMT